MILLDVKVVVEKNDVYWGDKARLDEVTFKYIPDSNTWVMALQAGEIQVHQNVECDQNQNFKEKILR
jgi:peptide/nickel transport system substrate-binding protein